MKESFLKTLFSWYAENKRDMPWRRTKDPYKIWVSEIILQQTRVEQGWDYYEHFIARFPDIRSLAWAKEEEVLKLWQGLGYYTRARNMHATAKVLHEKYRGVFPSSYEMIRELKGIGDYTAAAISSIVYGAPHPVVDGNVLRFFSRYFGIDLPVDTLKGKKEVHQIAEQYIDRQDPGEFNQAIMEFGALQCIPVPDCAVCPFHKQCIAFRQGKVALLPVKGKKTLSRERFFNYIVFVPAKKEKEIVFWMKKREENDIWKNFYDFPLIETSAPVKFNRLMKLEAWKIIEGNMATALPAEPVIYRHVLSHQVIHAAFYLVTVPSGTILPYIRITENELKKTPVPILIERFLRFFLPLQNKRKVKI